ncbi:MAG: hypothetical protein JWO80_4821 [Bryobacterales bacterium]|nr:hypothetical protein [Bryobacterales bacterium]
MKRRNLVLTATLFLCAMHTARAAEPRQQKPASGLLESYENPGFLTLDEDPLKQDAAYEELEFTRRFNNLVRALRDFSSTYNGGHVINVKQAKAVRKALRELEKWEWFHAEKGE